MEHFSINEYKNNPERSVMTRNGLDVRIVCTDFKAMGCPDKNTVIGLVTVTQLGLGYNYEKIYLFGHDGKNISRDSNFDLFFK